MSEPAAGSPERQTRTRRRTGSYAPGRARREAILDAAAEHFAGSGYHLTSMAQIAADVGLSGPGLQHHFPSKKHLLLAVVARRFDLAEQWASAVDEDDPLSPLSQLLAVTDRALTQPGMIELFVIMSAEAADPSRAAHDLFVTHYEKVVGTMTGRFLRGVERGIYRADADYRAVAEQCVAMTDGLQLQRVLLGGDVDLLGLLSAYLQQVAREILVDPAESRRLAVDRPAGSFSAPPVPEHAL